MAALYSLRLRRTLTTLTTLHRSLSTATPNKTRPLSCLLLQHQTALSSSSSAVASQSRSFRSSSVTLSQSRQYKPYNEGDEIGPDTILFEGCDYNHWLITVDFGKESKLPPEEMVRTYEEICAKGLNISIEEAKKKIYACSTTIYQGFQALMTEEESEKFKDVPGVVFVLPDSYIDPQNKEYGGDKYENGVITPRPPPVHYGRTGGRYGDRNRNPDRPRYDRQGGPMPNRQGNPQYDQQGNVQGDGRNYRPPQNYPPQQNYGPPQNNPPQQNYGPPQNNTPQQNYGPRQNYPPQPNYGPPPMNNRDYAPGGSDTYQADRRGPMPSYQGNYNQGQQGNYNQGQQGNYYPQERRDFPQDRGNYAPPGQREFRGDNRNYAPSDGRTYGQGASPSYGQTYPGQGEGQRFSQVEQRNLERDQTNYAPMEQTGTDQGRY